MVYEGEEEEEYDLAEGFDQFNIDDDVEINDDDLLVIESDEEMVQDLSDDSDFDISEVIVAEVDDSITTFVKHEGPVYACTFHPNGAIAASGCEEEMLYVWDIKDQKILLQEKFEDSVELIRFSHDGKYLAAVDMFGNFCCWKFNNNNFTKIHSWKYECPTWLEWHPQANVLLLCEKIYLCMWKVPTFDVAKYFTLECVSEAGCFMPDGKNALIACDRYAVILDLSTFTISARLKPPDMESNHYILSVDAHPDNNLVALGTKTGQVMLFTVKTSKMVGKIELPCTNTVVNYVETLKFGRDSLAGLLIVSTADFIYVYDNSKQVLRHSIQLSGHGTRLVCIEPYVYIATVKAVVDVCDCRTGENKFSLRGHTKSIMDISLSKDKKYLMTSSDDTTVKIYNLENRM